MKELLDKLVGYALENGIFLEQSVEVLEEALIAKALVKTEGNQCAASKLLGIHRNTLQGKMIKYKLQGRRVKRKPIARAAGKAAGRRAAS